MAVALLSPATAEVTRTKVKKIAAKQANQAIDAAIGCPAGATFALGVCVETSERPPATFKDAAGICAAAGRRLISMSELFGYESLPGVDIGSSPYEMTSDLWYNNPDFVYGIANNESDPQGANYATTTSEFRCVASPVSG
jgi:hypothetical protein